MLCLKLSDGKKAGERELDGQYYSSPVISGGKIYIVNRDGAVTILKADMTLEVLGKATFGEPIDATPAISGDCIFVRALKKLFCIAPNVSRNSQTATPKP